MNPFEYASPEKLEDAIALLADRWGETELLAGGTDLLTSLKQEIVSPKRLVSLKAVSELFGIEVSPDEIGVHAMTPLADMAGHAAIREHFPSLVQAIEGIGSPQIINMGVVGGDLCQRPRCWYFRQGFGLLGQLDGKSLIPQGDNRYHAVFDNSGPAYFVNPSSLAPGLIALGATVSIAGPGGRARQVKVAEFFRTPRAADERENVLEPNEIVTAIIIPISGMANGTYEVRQRAGLDWPLVTASVAFGGPAAARRAKVVLGHVSPTPHSAEKAAAVLEGKPVDEALATQAGEAAAQGAIPLSKNGYKVQLIKTAVKRAVLTAAGLMEG